VGEAIARVAGYDVSVLRAGVDADEGHEVDWVEDLAGPGVVDASGLREAGAGPFFEEIGLAGGGLDWLLVR